MYVQLLANQIPVDEVQIVTYHPGAVHSDGWAAGGITEDMLPFDNGKFSRSQLIQMADMLTGDCLVNLPGAYAVWAASEEAQFLHGRTVWASWDVEELASGEVRKHIDQDGDYLRISVVGLKGNNRAY